MMNNKMTNRRPARAFVEDMHARSVTLDKFIKLFCMWERLTPDERQEVYDICKTEHPDMYYGVFPEEDGNAD